VKAFFRDRRTLSMKMMKLGMRSVPLGKISWETWCLNYQGQRHYLRTMQILALEPLQYQHWTGPDMRLDISWRYRDIEMKHLLSPNQETLLLIKNAKCQKI
jgi:hypothetical protein